jgi:hypothetical protein
MSTGRFLPNPEGPGLKIPRNNFLVRKGDDFIYLVTLLALTRNLGKHGTLPSRSLYADAIKSKNNLILTSRLIVSCSEGLGFICRSGDRLYWLQCFLDFPQSPKHFRAITSNYVTTASFYTHLNNFFSNPSRGLDRRWVFQEVEAPSFQDNLHMKMVRLSALSSGRLYPPGNIPDTHFC